MFRELKTSKSAIHCYHFYLYDVFLKEPKRLGRQILDIFVERIIRGYVSRFVENVEQNTLGAPLQNKGVT